MKRYIHTADAVFALILFCAFAVSMLMVLMTGAQAYRGVRDRVENHYSGDTAISYIAMKLRHYDASDCSVTVGTLGDGDALFMTELIEETEFVTAIYFHDGYIKELFAENGYDFAPEDGFKIVAAQEMNIASPYEGVFEIKCVGTGGDTTQTAVALRSGSGVSA
ncbi:MAG: DUF4860 domain-containing protein [Oscillospiraceae bacterium]|jgi:hypothetical protein|nr:DUF4860 domain-containing protein [Oscillospiraceae bacterium]